MQVVTEDFVKNKKVLLRYDTDVALECKVQSARFASEARRAKCKVKEDFKLKAGLDTLRLCIQNASKVIIIGHVGRPFATAEDEKKGNPSDLSVKPIGDWFELHLRGEAKLSSGSHLGGEVGVDFAQTLKQASESTNRVVLLENIRFFHGEELGSEYHATCSSKTCDIDFAHKLAGLGDFYVNEAFSSYRPAVSTTVLPTLLPHAVGLHFVKEVETLLNVRNNPKKPFVAIIGGAKVKDKLPVIQVLAQKADAVLVGGKLVHEIREQNVGLPKNVMVGKLNEDGFDIASETVSAWRGLISRAAMIVWNGPLGKFEGPKYNQTEEVIKIVLSSGAEIVIGGGDSVAALSQYGLLEKAEEKAFVSVGGGAMLKLLSDGTLPTIEALQ